MLKLEYIKALVRLQVPTMLDVTFEAIQAKCHASLSKSCETSTTVKKKIDIACQLLFYYKSRENILT